MAVLELPDGTAPVEASPARWAPDPTLLNGTIPAILPEQCYSDNEPLPQLTLVNGKADIPGTRYGSFAMVDTPLSGSFYEGGPTYTAFAYSCIGDGTYNFVEVAVLDDSGTEVELSPNLTTDAVADLNDQINPGTSLNSSGPYQFAATGATLSLSGSWSSRPQGSLHATVAIAQTNAGQPITQTATQN